LLFCRDFDEISPVEATFSGMTSPMSICVMVFIGVYITSDVVITREFEVGGHNVSCFPDDESHFVLDHRLRSDVYDLRWFNWFRAAGVIKLHPRFYNALRKGWVGMIETSLFHGLTFDCAPLFVVEAVIDVNFRNTD